MEGLIVEIGKPEHTLGIIAISREDNKFLGWAPRGVFIDAVKQGKVIVAHDNKRVLGFCEFGGTTKDKWTIYKIATAKPMRNKGIGKALVLKLAEIAGENGAGVRLKVTEDNETAIGFYRKNGFEVVGVEPSKVRRVLIMERAV